MEKESPSAAAAIPKKFADTFETTTPRYINDPILEG
jgi:hypothetical protein